MFDNALKLEWINTRPDPRNIDLSGEPPTSFRLYVQWLYFEHFPILEQPIAFGGEYLTLGYCYAPGQKPMDIN